MLNEDLDEDSIFFNIEYTEDYDVVYEIDLFLLLLIIKVKVIKIVYLLVKISFI